MPVQRLNHVVLYVRNARTTADFYRDVLGFHAITEFGEGAAVFMQAPGSTNDHDIGLFTIGAGAEPSPAGRGGAVGMYHIAWEVDTLGELERIQGLLAERGALVGASDHGTTKALYAHDPDGLEFEVSWLLPADRITDADRRAGGGRPLPLDLAREQIRFGADLPGGVGVSHHAPSNA
jgi:catechol-2,3-dioxygenase